MIGNRSSSILAVAGHALLTPSRFSKKVSLTLPEF